MRISEFSRYALGVCAAAMFAGCGGGSGTPLSPSPAGVTAERTHVRPAYSVLYRFKGPPDDGAYPYAGLININGTLYGTTYRGGADSSYGTVFAITTSGAESVLYSFDGTSGVLPAAGLINVEGTLYGTAYAGGANGQGTVFSITPSGTENVLYSFKGAGDGASPVAGLLNVKGTLYGTTFAGGAGRCHGGSYGCGTVFSITTSGTEIVLHSFKGKSDGEEPEAALINVKGTLYGTTYNGGKYCSGSYGCGTAFSITTSGKETVLHSFGGTGDGDYPSAGLLNVNGTLYGTTAGGGTSSAGSVFAITPSGTETVLYSFSGSGDGVGPKAGLINVNGRLYGTTRDGGAHSYGTVFSITTSGTETVLHSFGGADGKYPQAGLINVKGTLYGTTAGGAKKKGTVFSLSP